LQDEIVRIRKQWQPVIQAIIPAADWGGEYATQVEPFLEKLDQEEAWRPLSATFRRIIAGERDGNVLLNGLDEVSAIVAGDVLRALGVEVLDPETESEDLTPLIEDIFRQTVLACQPDTPVVNAEQMYTITQKMADHPKLEPELRELGRVLNRILAGERQPDLSALSSQWARRVDELLHGLVIAERSVVPPEV
jgi:hypothetical protein